MTIGVACACYTINRTPTKGLEHKTPQEACSGNKPSIAHLKIFGSTAYVHVHNQRRGKLYDESEKSIIVGYSEQSKA